MLKKYISYIVLFCVALIFLPTVFAEEGSSNLEKGIWHFQHENYEESLNFLELARKEDPKSSLAAYYLGLTYKKLQDYMLARPHLEAAVSLRPRIKGALIELIDLLYRLDEIPEAKKWIRVAEEEGIRPDQTAFLKGLALLKEGDNIDEAVESLENARELNDSMAQVVNYHLGIARLKTKNLKDAKRLFEDIVKTDPTSDMALFAKEYLKKIDQRLFDTRPLKLMLGTYYQYDDNVTLKPDDDALAEMIAEKDDHRMIYAGGAEYDMRFLEHLGAKIGYSFYLADQFDLDSYDILSNNYTIQPAVYFKDAVIAFPVLFNQLVVDDKDYLYSVSLGNLTNYMFLNKHMLQGAFSYKYKDYKRKLSSFSENRDGHEYLWHLSHYYFFTKDKKGFVNLKCAMNYNDAKGNNWEYLGNKVSLTSLIPLHEKLKLTVGGAFDLQNFLNEHTVFDKKRRDAIFQVSSLLSVEIFRGTELQLQYTFVSNGSNLSVYDYTRNVYSAGVQYKF